MTRRELLATAAAVGLASKANAQSGVDWNTGAQDIVLWYDKPAARWADALPIGNGRLGAMVFGGGADDVPAKEFLQINEDTLWSGKPQDGNNREASRYLPAIRKAVIERAITMKPTGFARTCRACLRRRISRWQTSQLSFNIRVKSSSIGVS